jgi:hypothetical protein
MTPDERVVVEEVLRSQVGRSARWRAYDRALDSPMNIVLAAAEGHLGTPFTVYWVEDGLPEIFCLHGFSTPVVAFSTRAVELWADVRAALTTTVLGPELAPRSIERLALRLIAEFSLKDNDPEFAASTMQRSSMAGEGHSFAPNSIASLEQEPIGTPYMACWFYGLAHELGHFVGSRPDAPSSRGISDEDLLAGIDAALDRGGLPERVVDEARSSAHSNRAGHILAPDTLRDEVRADLFATSLLFETTVRITRMIDEGSNEDDPDLSAVASAKAEHRFSVVAFMSEMALSLNIIAMLERCRRTARHACEPVPTREHALETLLHPVSVGARLTFVRWYLDVAASQYVFGDHPTQQQRDQVSQALDAVMDNLRPAIEAAEKGLAAAMTVSLDRERRGSFLDVLEQWRGLHQTAQLDAVEAMAVERFCALAASLGKSSPVFDVMLDAVTHPSTPPQMHVTGNAYSCPWVVGPDGFSRPFGLDTRHGHLIFIFTHGSAIYEPFCESSATLLKEGYSIASTALIANTERELREAIARHVRPGKEFRLVIEGTEDFATLIQELAADTIWE